MRIVDYIQEGGPIMYILVLLNIVGLAIMLSKFFIFSNESSKAEDMASGISNDISGKIKSSDANAIIEIAKQELQSHVSKMEKGLNTVKIIASISPLLGLLGTVIGVLVAFKVMSQTGLNNPASFAKGISMALITTVGGMIVAIPHYIGHSYLIGMLDKLEADLEKRILTKVL
jgi:biopolymer transport protein ExbB